MENSTRLQDTECVRQLAYFYEVIDIVNQILCVLGTFLNIISVFILSRPSMDTLFNRLLACLALFDMGYVLSYALIEFNPLQEMEDWRLGRGVTGVVIMVLHTICLFSYKASSSFTMAASIERYVSVTYPVRNLSRRLSSCLYIVPALLFSAASIIPGLQLYEFKHVNETLTIDLHAEDDKSYCLFIFNLIHDTILLVLNYKIYSTLKKVNTTFQYANPEQQRQKEKQDKKCGIILILIVSSSIFSHLLCYTMAVAKWPLGSYLQPGPHKDCGQPAGPLWYAYVFQICITFAILNCSVNFFIYNFTSDKFKSIFVQYFFCKKMETQLSSTRTNTLGSSKYDKCSVNQLNQKNCQLVKWKPILSKSIGTG